MTLTIFTCFLLKKTSLVSTEDNPLLLSFCDNANLLLYWRYMIWYLTDDDFDLYLY